MQLPHSSTGKVEGQYEDNSTGNQVTVNGIQNTVPEPDFSEFMWMASEDLEAFDRKVISELDESLGITSSNSTPIPGEEEELLQSMLIEEEERETVYFVPTENGSVADLSHQLNSLGVSGNLAAQSNLNPLAAEFVPAQDASALMYNTPAANLPQVNMVPHPGQIYSQSPSLMHLEAHLSQSHSPVHGILQQAPHPSSLGAMPQGSHNLIGQIPMQMNSLVSRPTRPQYNGHGAAISNYYNNVPIYVQGMPFYRMMNGSPFIRPQSQFFNVDVDRGNDDEGYGDN